MTAPTQIRRFKSLDTALGDGGAIGSAGSAGLDPVFWANGTPVNGTSGTLAGVAGPGSLLLTQDGSTVAMYQNTGTLASPTWSPAANGTGISSQSVTSGITASTTQTRGNGLLTSQINNVTTVANAGDANTLPALVPGQFVIVFNSGAHAMSIFPNGASDTIDGGSGGAAVTLTNPHRAIFFCVAANTILSAQLGVAAA